LVVFVDKPWKRVFYSDSDPGFLPGFFKVMTRRMPKHEVVAEVPTNIFIGGKLFENW